MGFNTNGRNAMAAGITDVAGYLSVHTTIPDSSGSGEVTGGGYTRETVTWDSPDQGTVSNAAQVEHDIPAGTTVVAYGLWSAATDGTYYGHLLIGSTVSGAATVDPATDTFTSPGHGLVDGARVAFAGVAGQPLPTGLSATTLYHVVSATADTFQVAASSGGGAVDIATAGEVWFEDCVPETFSSAGLLRAAAGAVTVDTSVL